ncbi:MAG: dTDP-4-dehydrorhamnose 3,5-epimerase [Chitinophagales bacterium]|nr:dTDP-4-dehydrorhamnose 3,5-epimerase [Chitinophagales bacterium]
MQLVPTKIPDLKIIQPRVFEDERGFFYESYSERVFTENGIPYKFVQDNHSKSSYGVLRGLHYQLPPYAQTKLVRVIKGSVLDVAVDIRQGSPTYLQHVAIELSAENKTQLLIPQGFAHGFVVLSEEVEFLYKCDNFYHKASEGGIIFNDAALGIDWKIPEKDLVLSQKDLENPTVENAHFNFPFEQFTLTK